MLRPGALGDTLLAVPALRALRRSFAPPLRLGAHAAAARLLACVAEIDEGLAFDDPSLAWTFGDNVTQEPVVAWMQAEVRCARLVAPSRPPDATHCARYLLGTLQPLGVDLAFDDTPLRMAAPIGSDEVLIHPGSGSAAKNWPPARFAEVIRALDAPVRLVVGEADREAASLVQAALPGRELPRLEQPALGHLARRLAGCRAYLGNDSGISHLAGLCGARTVTLFGPSDPRVWRPLGPDVHVLPFDASAADVVRRLTD